MFPTEAEAPVITEFLRKLPGSSRPVLVRASDGLCYVVKFRNNPQGASVLFAESAGTELYRACGLPTPSWKALSISDAFIDRTPELWMETVSGLVRPEAGLCFGSRAMDGTEGSLLEILPGSSIGRVENRLDFWLAWLVDMCAAHADNRQAIFQAKANGQLRAVFIDHGHLFGGPQNRRHLPLSISRYLEKRIYSEIGKDQIKVIEERLKSIDFEMLAQRIDALPDEWKTTAALEAFDRCLELLSQPSFVKHMIGELVESGVWRSTPAPEWTARKQPAVVRPSVERPVWLSQPVA